MGLEQPHVEDVMKPCALQKLQAVGNGADVFQNMEWIDKLWAELALRLRVKGLSRLVEQAQIDQSPTANSNCKLEMSSHERTAK